MKKVFCLAASILILSLCGCEYSYSNENNGPQASDNANATQGTDNNGADNNTADNNETEVKEVDNYGAALQGADAADSGDTDSVSESDVEVVAEYSLTKWSDQPEYFLVVKNNSEKTIRIYSSAIAYDKKGEEVGVAEGGTYALPSGCETALYHEFQSTENAKKFTYDLEAVEETYYQPAIQNVKLSIKKLDKKAIVKCKNTGEDDIEYLKARILFFKGKKLVEDTLEDFTNSKKIIVPGKEITKQFVPIKDFDDVKVYLYGGIDKAG